MSNAVRMSDIRVEVKWTVMSSSTGMFINTNLWEGRKGEEKKNVNMQQLMFSLIKHLLLRMYFYWLTRWKLYFENMKKTIN